MKIQDLLNQSKPCWKYAATDESGEIYFYSAKPIIFNYYWYCPDENANGRRIDNNLKDFFDIEPFDGYWKDSLIEREE